MSNSEITKQLTKPMLRSLNKASQKRNRKKVERQPGQLLILNDISVFREIIESSLGIKLSSSSERRAMTAATERAESLQNTFRRMKKYKYRYGQIVERLPEVLPASKYKVGENVFIVANFSSSITAVKKAIFDSLISDGEITKGQSTRLKKQIHKGHGVRGNAVSEVGIALSMNKMNERLDTKDVNATLQKNLGAYMMQGKISLKEAHEIAALTIKYDQMVTPKGKLRAQYFSIVDFQSGKENSGKDAQKEKALVEAFRKYFEFIAPKLADIKGSSTLKQKVEKQLVSALTGNKLYKNIKVKTSTRKYSSKSKGVSKVRQKKGKKPKVTIARVTRLKKARNTRKGSASSPFELIVALNKALPATIRANMGSPKLNYRSGAFASSVQVTNIITPARGFPTIDYTYQQAPYGVFELGAGPLATKERDPRNIIDETIRELAQYAAFRKFHTRRVF